MIYVYMDNLVLKYLFRLYLTVNGMPCSVVLKYIYIYIYVYIYTPAVCIFTPAVGPGLRSNMKAFARPGFV